MKYTVENVKVCPIDQKKLAEYFSKFFKLAENEEFIIDKDSLLLNTSRPMLIDNECCSGYLEIEFNKETLKKELCVKIGIRRSKKTDTGVSYPIEFECYLPIFESDWIQNDLLLPEIPLKDFMGSRFNYNPRIESNTYRVVKAINQNSK